MYRTRGFVHVSFENEGLEVENGFKDKNLPNKIKLSTSSKRTPKFDEEIIYIQFDDSGSNTIEDVETGSYAFEIVLKTNGSNTGNVVKRLVSISQPVIGRLETILKFDEDSKYKESFKIGEQRNVGNIEEMEEGEIKLTSQRKFAVRGESLSDAFAGELEDAADAIKAFTTAIALTTFGGLTAVPIIVQTTGAAEAGLLMLATTIEVLPKLASQVSSFPGADVGAAVNSVLMNGDSSFFFAPPENLNSSEGPVLPEIANCPLGSISNSRGETVMEFESDDISFDGDQVPLSTGPHVVAEPLSQPLKSVRVESDVQFSDVAWGRLDEEGRSELALSGDISNGPSFNPQTRILQSTGDPNLTDLANADVVDVGYSSLAWGNAAEGNPQDLIVSGYKSGGYQPVTKVYSNNGGTLEPMNAGIVDVGQGDVSWVDYNDDGRSDILVTGYSETDEGGVPSVPVTKLYRNTGSGFEEVGAGLTGLAKGDVAWGDYDGDGDRDLVLTGRNSEGEAVTEVYENTDDGFEKRFFGLPDVGGVGGTPGTTRSSAVAWGDYNDDGNADLVISGRDEEFTDPVLQVYRSTGSGLTLEIESQVGLRAGDLEWVDIDQDGHLDISAAGITGNGERVTATFRNQAAGSISGIFDNINFYSGAGPVSMDWGDFDGDGFPDLIVSGLTTERDQQARYGKPKTILYRNLSDVVDE